MRRRRWAGGEPALSQGLVEELAGCRPALPARAARHAAVAGPTHARRGAARACCTADVACASWRSRGLLGRGPPGCTWDPQRGGWWRADGSAWKKVRNEKRLQAREARRVEKAPEKAAERKRRERFAAYWAEEKAKCKEERESLKRAKEERLQLKSEARQAREAEAEARKARVQEVLCDGETVYCAKHLHELDVVGWDGERCIAHAKCGACVELGWRDVRRASPPERFAHASPKLTSIRARAGAFSLRTGASSARTSRKASSA